MNLPSFGRRLPRGTGPQNPECAANLESGFVQRFVPIRDAGERPALRHLDQAPAQFAEVAPPQRQRIGGDFDSDLVHRASRLRADLVMTLGDDRHVIHLVEQLSSQRLDLGIGRITACEDAEVDAELEQMRLAPSSGVSSFCSTAVRTSWIRRPATCHFGSIVRPKSVGFIEANWWTNDGVTVSAIRSITPLGRIRVLLKGANRRLSVKR